MSSITVDALQQIYEQYKDNFESGFHNVLWQLMINGDENGWAELMARGDVAFTALAADNALGIASRNQRGYTPTMCHFRAPQYSINRELVDRLNRDVFGIEPREAFNIVSSSMRGK